MSCEELEIVWTILKPKPERWRTVSQCWPVFPRDATQARKPWQCTELHAGDKLSSPIMPAIAIREVVEEASPLTRK